jgi:hypothetical protein
MFRAMISPIFRSIRLCLQPGSGGTPLPGYRPATSWMNFTTSCKHSLVLLKMGEIIARNMSSWLEFLKRTVIVAPSWLSILDATCLIKTEVAGDYFSIVADMNPRSLIPAESKFFASFISIDWVVLSTRKRLLSYVYCCCAEATCTIPIERSPLKLLCLVRTS